MIFVNVDFYYAYFTFSLPYPIVYKEIKLTLSKFEVSLLVLPKQSVSHVATLENQLPIPDLNG